MASGASAASSVFTNECECPLLSDNHKWLVMGVFSVPVSAIAYIQTIYKDNPDRPSLPRAYVRLKLLDGTTFEFENKHADTYDGWLKIRRALFLS